MKCYAVKAGRETGIFYTWAECQAQVKGYSGAKFKSFGSEAEAQAFLQADAKQDETECEAYAYTDGSYNLAEGITGGGGIVFFNGREYPFATFISEPDINYDSMKNVGGEILAVMAAINKAKELGISSLHVYHDYEGVGAWTTGEWKANKVATKAYTKFVKECGVRLSFTHVSAHTGIAKNEAADRIAKFAVGLIGSEIRMEYPMLQWVKTI